MLWCHNDQIQLLCWLNALRMITIVGCDAVSGKCSSTCPLLHSWGTSGHSSEALIYVAMVTVTERGGGDELRTKPCDSRSRENKNMALTMLRHSQWVTIGGISIFPMSNPLFWVLSHQTNSKQTTKTWRHHRFHGFQVKLKTSLADKFFWQTNFWGRVIVSYS